MAESSVDGLMDVTSDSSICCFKFTYIPLWLVPHRQHYSLFYLVATRVLSEVVS